MSQLRFSRKARWAVPAGAVAAAGLVVAGSMLASAQAAPSLPARTAAQLLAEVAGSGRVPSALSGVIAESAALGLPQLPGVGGSSSPYSQLAGSHSFSFWYAGPAQVRIAVPVQLGETDLRQDGRQVWLWDSTTNTATRIVLPQRAGGPGIGPGAAGAAPGSAPPLRGGPASRVLTPQQAARQVLAAVGPTTTVSVQQNVTVAGQAAYQLAIAPKASGSLVGQIRIAIDSRGYLPLRLQVFARGATSPAYQIGFTALSFARPAASNFAFTPPPGAKIKTVRLPASGASLLPGLPGILAGGAAGQTVHFGAQGPSWEQRRSVAKSLRAALRNERKMQLKGLTAAQRKAMVRSMGKVVMGKVVMGKVVVLSPANGRPASFSAPKVPAGSISSEAFPAAPHGTPLQGALAGLPPGDGPTVIGQGWLSVVVTPPAPGLAALVRQPAGSAARSATFSSPSPSAAYSSTLTVTMPGQSGPEVAAARALLRAATPVHGSWGSGRLLRTSLLSVLFTSTGRVLLGAVTPAVLYAAAAKVK